MIKIAPRLGIDLIWRSWAILGPVILALTISLAFMRFHASPIPFVAIAGLLLTHFAKWRGLFASAALLGITCAVLFFFQPLPLWIWDAVFAAACLASLVVARLGFDEYELRVARRLLDAERINMAAEDAEEAFQSERSALLITIETLKGEVQRASDALAAKEHLLGLTRDEIGVIDVDRQRVMKSFVETQRVNDDMKQKINDLTIQIQETTQQQSQELNEYIKTLESEKEQALSNYQKLVEEVAENREVRRMQGFYNQLREQFEEKSKVLDETRRELFAAQEKVASAEHASSSHDLIYNKAHDEYCKQLLAAAAEEVEHLEQEIVHLQAVIDSLMAPQGFQEVKTS